MSYPIDGTIPAANNNPAADQPLMQANFLNTKNYLSVDHITPGATGDGFHKQVTYFTENIPGGTPVDPASIAFTANAAALPTTRGSASTVAQNFFKNASGIFPLSAIRAFGVFKAPTTTSVVNILNGFNVGATVSYTSSPLTADFYTFTIETNCVTVPNFLILSFPGIAVLATPALTNTVSLFHNTGATDVYVSFVVLQI